MNETHEITKQAPKKSAFDQLAANLNLDRGNVLQLLKRTICPEAATDEQIAAFAIVAGKYRLDPFLKQIYAFPNKQGGMTPVVSIDGWLAIINSHPNFDGMTVTMAPDGSSATCTIYVKDRAHPVEITEYLEECKRNTEQWRGMPRRMLRHKAIIQAGRVAFNISGIYDEDEARDIAEGPQIREAKSRTVEAEKNPFDAFSKPKQVENQEAAADEIPGLEQEAIEA